LTRPSEPNERKITVPRNTKKSIQTAHDNANAGFVPTELTAAQQDRIDRTVTPICRKCGQQLAPVSLHSLRQPPFLLDTAPGSGRGRQGRLELGDVGDARRGANLH
jgi:hypothetical protein